MSVKPILSSTFDWGREGWRFRVAVGGYRYRKWIWGLTWATAVGAALIPRRRLLAAWRGDLAWADAQVSVSLGLLALRGDRPDPAAARFLLEAALRSVRGRVQHREIIEQRLGTDLAEAYRLAAAEPGATEAERAELLRKGLDAAAAAVACEPAGYEEHKVLGKIYFDLGDYERAREEWHVCRVVRSDPEVLNLLGEALWRQALDLQEVSGRRRALGEAMKTFEAARWLIEKDSESLPEAHGQAHFWLGRFCRELGHLDKAIFNFRVAMSLGARPLEARMSLGWAYLEARMYGPAEDTFRGAWREAHRQIRELHEGRPSPTSHDSGQEMPVGEVACSAIEGSPRARISRLRSASCGGRCGSMPAVTPIFCSRARTSPVPTPRSPPARSRRSWRRPGVPARRPGS
jgi:tetratricopeptide (TPR) repeat protein